MRWDVNAFPLAKKKNILLVGLVFIIAVFAVIVGMLSPLFFVGPVNAATGSITLKDVSEGYINGTYKIMSANNISECFDVENGTMMENGVRILSYQSHTNSNQKFNFTPVDRDGNGNYIYKISTSYCDNYVLDIIGCSPDENVSLQLYEDNRTNAQKFMIKGAYVGEEFKGYVLLTGSSNYTKVLMNSNGCIVQKSLNYNSLDLRQLWFFEQCFLTYVYKNPGYYDLEKQLGTYNALDYGITGHEFHGFYHSGEAWESMEQFLTIDTSKSFKSTNGRISSDGYTFLEAVSLNIKIDNEVRVRRLGNSYYEVATDNSNYANGKYVNGTIGKGTVEVERTDDNGKKYSRFYNNIFEKASPSMRYCIQDCDEVGKYSVRFYYKVSAASPTYVMKEINFAIISPSHTATALAVKDDVNDPKVISSYTFSLNNKSDISVKYDGQERLRAQDQEIINYVAGVTLGDGEQDKATKINDFKDKIAKYNEYKVFFTNGAFYIDAYGNKHVKIEEHISGYNSVITNAYMGKTPINNTDGIYEYETKNLYDAKKSFYRVYVQCQPNQQVFRNVTYAYKNENDEIINYAIDYAFLEDLKIFPYTMTVSITYTNLDDENATPVNYISNSIIYNTGSDILRLKFVVLDLSGNETTLFLYIYPPNTPSLNFERLMKVSSNYNYITTGYGVELYDSKTKSYKKNLFSTFDVAFENLISNILSSEDTCVLHEDGSYSVNFKSINKKFADNYDLMEWLYGYAETAIQYKNITPDEYGEYLIPEKSMRFDTLYLTQDFVLVTDEHFQLFESYKIYFRYCSQDGTVIKEGIFTYNGDYKYGQTMLEILADGKQEKWIDGYVDFIEYNISANSGTKYTARIVNSNSSIELKFRDGTKYETRIYSDQESITCEEFEFEGKISEDTTVVVECDGVKNYYNYFTYQNIKFKENGNYVITVINTHKKAYTINILVEGLASNFKGVSNFGSTTDEVKFTTGDLNFTCYINGKLSPNLAYVVNRDGVYEITFKRQTVDSNIHIVKDGKTFSFVIEGEEDLDLSDYNLEEFSKYTLDEVRKQIVAESEKLDSIASDIDSLINEINAEESNDIKKKAIESKYDSYRSDLVTFENKKQRFEEEYERVLENKLINRLHPDKVALIKEKIDLVSNLYQTKYEDLKDFAIEYFSSKYDKVIITESIFGKLSGMKEAEIVKAYEDYLIEVDKYAKLSSRFVTVESNIYSYKDVVKSYKQTIREIDGNKIESLESAASVLKQFEKYEKEFFEKIAAYKAELTKQNVLHSNNVFVKEYLIDDVKLKINKIVDKIDDIIQNKDTGVYVGVKNIAVKVVGSFIEQSYAEVGEMKQNYLLFTNAKRELEEEKEWWKIFSNISRNKKIENYAEKISNVIMEFGRKKWEIEEKIPLIVNYLKQIKQSDNVIIEDYIFNQLKTLNSDLNKVSGEMV